MVIVLLTGTLAAFVGQLDALKLKSRLAQDGDAALQAAREALITYAATYRDAHADAVFGYLPCPDTTEKTGLFQPGDGTASASCGTADQIAVGLLPYKTLGLPDLRDADGNCLWYAVSGSFKNSPKPSTPMNWDTQGQLTVSAETTRLTAPDDANGGAAAVVISPGPALVGKVRQIGNQPCGADPAAITAYLESSGNNFTHGVVRSTDGTTTHNDRLAWVAPRDIFRRVTARADFRNPLGATPEGRMNRFIATMGTALEGRLLGAMAAMTASSSGRPGGDAAPLNQADYTQYAGKLIGDLPQLKPLAALGNSYDSDFDHWQDQSRYVVCDDLKPVAGCLSFGTQTCRGVLLFGGQARTDTFPFGGPRPAAQKPRTPPPARTDYLPNYFETGAGLDLLAGPALTYTGATAYAADTSAADTGICLAAGAYASFAKDIATVVPVTSSTTHPEVAINAAAATLTLGNTAATTGGRGCTWLPTPLPFTSSLRAYFKLRIADLGEGFVFALVDAAGNQAALRSGNLCGNTTGAQLGYSDGIAAPKFGLEVDTRVQATANCNGNNRNDPGAHHMAFVYWGTTAATTDDNCHGAGTLASAAQPLNPRTLTGAGAGIKTVQASDPHLPYAGSLPLNTDIHVRLDVAKHGGTAASPTVTLSLKAYIASEFLVFAGSYVSTCESADIRNLAADLADLCLQDPSLTQDDIAVAADAALATIYAGFTNAQSTGAAGLQRITISDFAIRTQ